MKFDFVTSKITPAVPDSHRVVIVRATDLPIHCPTRTDSRWNMHPKVFIPVEQSPNGEALCPYCGMLYRLHQGAEDSA